VTLVDVTGWLGAIALLAAYAMLSGEKVTARSRSFVLLNAAGSMALTVNGFVHGALPSAALNVVWLAIAGKALHSARQPSIDKSRSCATSPGG
jgi:hypothetical protein